MDHRHTLNRRLVRNTWAMPNNDAPNFDSFGGVRYISVADVQSATYMLLVPEDEVESTTFVTERGKYCFKHMSLGVCKATLLFHRMMSLLGATSGLPLYMDDLIMVSTTCEDHLRLLGRTFAALSGVDN